MRECFLNLRNPDIRLKHQLQATKTTGLLWRLRKMLSAKDQAHEHGTLQRGKKKILSSGIRYSPFHAYLQSHPTASYFPCLVFIRKESAQCVCSGSHHSAELTQEMRCLFSSSNSHTKLINAMNVKIAGWCSSVCYLPHEQSTFFSTFTTFDLLKWNRVLIPGLWTWIAARRHSERSK